ncbi:MAG: GntR family transcriptional regulator [Actinomycetota bacterium]|nr:GntR family transcriptional regulator [Actinomycetota bacterium]
MSTGTEEVTRPRSKADQAHEMIRQWIVEGIFEPGERLVLERIARELDVSVVPVREALRRLEAEGYATFERNVGARVSMIETPAYGESMEMLAILEGAATALAVAHLARRDLQEARRINARMAARLEHLDPVELTQRNKAFHETLYRRCPNGRLVAEIDREWSRLAVIRRSTFVFVPHRAPEAIAEHLGLLEAIGAGAPEREIELLVREHTLATAHAFLDRARRDAEAAER